MRPQSSMGFGKNIYKLKNSDKATLYAPIEARVMPAPTSKRPEEREFVVDSGASMHTMSKKELSSDELDTLRRSRNPTVVLTANGGSAHPRGSTSCRSRSKSIRDCKYSRKRQWSYQFENSAKTTETPMSGSAVKKPRLTKDGKTDNYIQNGQFRTSCRSWLSTNSASVSSSTSPPQDSSSSSSSPALERSDEMAPRCDPSETQKKKKEGWQSRCGRPFARSSWVAGGVHR